MRPIMVFCLVLLVCISCAGPLDSRSELKGATFRFGEAMRWRNFEGAALFLQQASQNAFVAQFPVVDDDLQIVGSQIEAVVFNRTGDAAEVIYQLEYYRLPSTRVKKWRWRQQWRLQSSTDDDGAVWLIENPPPWLP